MRFVSGIIGIPLMILSLFIWNGTPFILAIGLLSILGLKEFYRGARKVGAEPQEWLAIAWSILFLLVARERFHPSLISLPSILTIFVIASFSIELLRRNRAPIRNLGATYLGLIYVGWLFSYLVALQSISEKTQMLITGFEIPLGGWLVLFVVFAAWAADTGAYLIGRKWGRHKMSPVLSPGKSWEGAIAGVTWSII
ncbi:MAG: phosphatidate cytidylyltransferase, partial [Armatimonadota bacterium]|nr:phosphatidate cytidylyltransferase [Armatimonadota bacterium]